MEDRRQFRVVQPTESVPPVDLATISSRELEERAFFGPRQEQAVHGPLHDMYRDDWETAQQLADARRELQAFIGDQEPHIEELFDPLPQIETPLSDAIARGGEMGEVARRSIKKRAARQKEQAPRKYQEKLLFLGDVQLLKLTHQENFGAILRYLEDQAGTFTHVVLAGDIFDFTQQSSFPSDNSEGDRVTSDEIEAGKWFIDWMNTRFGHAKRIFTKGNHEARYDNLYKNTTNGVKQWLVPFVEMFGLESWEMYEYGKGQSYDFHGTKLWHGDKGGPKSNVPKLELERAFRSVGVAHSPINKSWEVVDADGNILRGDVIAGVSDHPEYSKNGYKQVSDGFGVYFWSRANGKDVKNNYTIAIPINNPVFISPEGNIYEGTGFNLRQEIGLDPKPARRGRPRKN